MNPTPLPSGLFMPGTLINLALGALLAAMAGEVAPGWTDIGLLGVYALVYLGLLGWARRRAPLRTRPRTAGAGPADEAQVLQ